LVDLFVCYQDYSKSFYMIGCWATLNMNIQQTVNVIGCPGIVCLPVIKHNCAVLVFTYSAIA